METILMKRKTEKSKKIVLTLFLAVALSLLTGCFGTSSNLPPLSKYGNITGTVVSGVTGETVSNVNLFMTVRGVTYTAATAADGTFSLDTGEITRGEGFTLHFNHESFTTASRAVVFDIPSLRVELGTVTLQEKNNASEEKRSVTGKVVNYLGNPLEGAIVSMQNSSSPPGTIHAITGADGSFTLEGTFLYAGSSYNITVSKANHITRTSATVTINGLSSVIDESPVYLFPNHGAITGHILDDTTGQHLQGATVTATDEGGTIKTTVTDAEGKFRLESEHFYIEKTYTVHIEKDNYRNAEVTVTINSLDDNTISGADYPLMINGTITGNIISSGGSPVAGVTVATTNSSGTIVTATSSEGGAFVLESENFRKNHEYALTFSHDQYEEKNQLSPALVAGSNDCGTIQLVEKSYDYILAGTVADAWDPSLKVAATIRVLDDYGHERTATSDSETGKFSLGGYFLKGKTYELTVQCAGYTGSISVEGETMSVTITGDMPQGEPQSLGTVLLFPLGIRARINGTARLFSEALKQSNEKFITGKQGFTFSGRTSADRNSYSSFYIHADENTTMPVPPGGGRSVQVGINKTVRGSLVNGLQGEETTRMAVQKPSAFNIRPYSMYHFRVVTPGEVTIETGGETDTSLVLYYQNGSQLAVDDNSGEGNNGRIVFNTASIGAGWYFIKVHGGSDNAWGIFTLSVTGPEQDDGTTGTWSRDNMVLSWYSNADRVMYIAGKNETGSTGAVTISIMGRAGQIARGSFTGTLRAITPGGETVTVTDGYFNTVRSE